MQHEKMKKKLFFIEMKIFHSGRFEMEIDPMMILLYG